MFPYSQSLTGAWKSDIQVKNSISVRKSWLEAVTRVCKSIRKVNKPHSLPQPVRFLRYKLDSRDCYHKDTLQPSISSISWTETKIKNSQHLDESYLSIDSHGTSLVPQSQMVNDIKYARDIRERNPQTQDITTNMSDRVQNQSSRQAFMASIRARRSSTESAD